jgi:hypothetical protein
MLRDPNDYWSDTAREALSLAISALREEPGKCEKCEEWKKAFDNLLEHFRYQIANGIMISPHIFSIVWDRLDPRRKVELTQSYRRDWWWGF